MVKPLAEDLVKFVQTQLGSVWALRLMLIMREEPARAWTVEPLRLELRASDILIASLLERFERTGLAIREEGDVWYWRPAIPEIDQLARDVADAYAVTPFGVIQAIAEAPTDRLRQFADAFRLKKSKDKEP
jgi:hypothetical protein